jgi:hypothetical protein
MPAESAGLCHGSAACGAESIPTDLGNQLFISQRYMSNVLTGGPHSLASPVPHGVLLDIVWRGDPAIVGAEACDAGHVHEITSISAALGRMDPTPHLHFTYTSAFSRIQVIDFDIDYSIKPACS